MMSATADTPHTAHAPGGAGVPVHEHEAETVPARAAAAPSQAVSSSSQQTTAPASALTDSQVAQLLGVLRLLGQAQVAQILSSLEPRVLKPALFQLYLQNSDLFPKPAPVASSRSPVGELNSANRPTERELGAAERKQTQAKAIADAIAEAEAKGMGVQAERAQLDPVLTEIPSMQVEGAASPAGPPHKAPEPAAEDGYSRRISPRKTASNNARIIGTTDRRGVNAEILDISDTGALIRVQGEVSISDRFFLYDFGNRPASELVANMPRRSCQIVWRKRSKLGVRFVE